MRTKSKLPFSAKARIRVGIVGVTGYAGQELLRILLAHPRAAVSYLASSGAGDPAQTLRHFGDLPVPVRQFDISACAAACDTVFLSLPHETALASVPSLLSRGLRVLDLSAAFRLKTPGQYETFYRFRHTAPHLLKSAVYGLPEVNRRKLPRARLVAVPGCYPTGAILPLAPLLKRRLIAGPAFIDAKSGVTGAGKQLRADLMFAEVNENVCAYGLFTHRHIPEIGQELSRLTGKPFPLVFVPHLVPLNRGILTTVYVSLRDAVSPGNLVNLVESYYRGSPFVRLLKAGQPGTRSVRGTNFADIAVCVSGRQAVLTSAIDNLGKGAAGQAVQSFNIQHSLPETTGLLAPAGAP